MTLHAKTWQFPRNNGTLETFVWFELRINNFVSSICLFFCDFSAKATCAFLFIRSNVETSGNKRFSSHKNHGISSTLGLLGYHCKSGVAIFAWRVTWKYANIPFKQLSYRVTHKGCDFRDDIQNWPSFISTFLVFFQSYSSFLKNYACNQCRNQYYALYLVIFLES